MSTSPWTRVSSNHASTHDSHTPTSPKPGIAARAEKATRRKKGPRTTKRKAEPVGYNVPIARGVLADPTIPRFNEPRTNALSPNEGNVSDSEQFSGITTLTLWTVIRPDRSEVSATPQSKTVLCIDDDPDLLECEKAFLESFGYTVLTAPSGKKGLELASVHSVDVVIVDYVMPEMNGQELAVEMRWLKPHATIIMLSGKADVPEQALKSADVFIAKSLLASRLLSAIAQLQAY